MGQGEGLRNIAFQQWLMNGEFEILSSDKDLVARGRYRFLQTEEFRLGREIDGTGAALPANRNLVRAVANDFARNLELRRRAERIIRADLSGGYRSSIYQQFVTHL